MINLKSYKDKRIHFIGIGGCSMSGLALILSNAGYDVSGSDQRESSYTNMLLANGLSPAIGHSEENVKGAGLVVYTAAIKPTNPEFAYAKSNGIPMVERSELLGIISGEYGEVIAISGCHGKTTITSMLALILMNAEKDPTVHVGGMVNFLGGGVRVGNSDVFLTEACEYVRSFMTLQPKYILVNNIDDDHLDYYKDINEIRDTFAAFTALLPEDGVLFINKDDELTRTLVPDCKCAVVTYGQGENCDFTLDNVAYDENGYPSFDVIAHGNNIGSVKLNVPGLHNAMNALSAIAIANHVFGIPADVCAEALAEYSLAERRFQYIGERDGVKYYHDYAHHPAEIAACLAAAKNTPHKKLWALFQCNSFTRARTLKDKYAHAFHDADCVLMPDIYWGRDLETGGMTSEMLYQAIQDGSGNCVYIPTFEEIREYLTLNAKPGDIVVTLGSGDVNKQQYKLL